MIEVIDAAGLFYELLHWALSVAGFLVVLGMCVVFISGLCAVADQDYDDKHNDLDW